MTTPLNDVIKTNTSESFAETITFVGSVGSIICYFSIIVVMIGMGMRGPRAHIHCNTSTSFLLTHILLLVGGRQSQGSNECKMVALFTQVSCLIALAWLLVEVIYLFGLSMVGCENNSTKKNNKSVMESLHEEDTERRGQQDNNHVVVKDSNLKESLVKMKKTRKQRRVKMVIYYVIAWFGPMLYAAATFPAVVDGYGEAKNCWLAADTNVIWVYGAPVPAIFIFHCILSWFAIRNFKGRINYAKLRQFQIPSCNSSRKTRTTLISTSTNDPAAGEDIPSTSSSKSDTALIPGSHQVFQDQRRELVRTKAHRGVVNKSSLRRHRAEDRNQQNGGKIIVYPPLHEVQKTTMSIGLSSREIEGPLNGYVTTLYWQAALVPFVSVVWMFGVLSVNFNTPLLRYVFSMLNILQALYMSAFYCVVDYKLRHKWHVMTTKKLNARGRAVSIVIDEEDVIEYETNRAKTRYPTKRFPNIELMNRTPTPFGKKHRLVQFQTSPTKSLTPELTCNLISSKNPSISGNFTRENSPHDSSNASKDNTQIVVDDTSSVETRNPNIKEEIQNIYSMNEQEIQNNIVDGIEKSSQLPGHVSAQNLPQPKVRPPLLKSFSEKKFANKKKSLRSTVSMGKIIEHNDPSTKLVKLHNPHNKAILEMPPTSIFPPNSNYKQFTNKTNDEFVLQSYDSDREVWN